VQGQNPGRGESPHTPVPDLGDDLVIDCAMNASAIVITSNLRDFKRAKESLGLSVLTPVELVIQLASEGNLQ
jgi:hypothetical protein